MNLGFTPQGLTTGFSVTASAHTAVQVQGAQGNPNCQAYLIVNTSTTVDVFVAMGTTAPTAAIPADGATGNGFCVPHNSPGMVVQGPPNAFFSLIGSAAGPALVYITPGEGATH